MDKNLRAYMAEMIGTFVVVFVSAGAVIVNQLAAVSWLPQADSSGVVVVPPQLGLVGIALATGLIYAAALAITLPLSSGYLNPAVTLTLWVFKRLDGVKTLCLIGVQLLGAVLAGALLRGLFSFREDVLTATFLGTPHLNVGAFELSREALAQGQLGTLLKGIAIELILTFFVVFAIFGTTLDPRATRWAGRMGSLWVGLVLVAITLLGFNLTGAAVNPARWFGPAVWEMTVPPLQTQRPFADHAVYWIGSIVGALLAGGLYTAWILPAEDEQRMPFETHAASSVPVGTSSTRVRAKK